MMMMMMMMMAFFMRVVGFLFIFPFKGESLL